MAWTKITREDYDRRGGRYASDLTDREWALIAPFIPKPRKGGRPRTTSMRDVMDSILYMASTGCQWRMLPNDFPPWHAVYQQTQRWLKAGVFETMVHDLREVLRLAAGRNAQPSAAIFDRRTLQSSPESGARAGYDGAKRRKGSKTHMAVDTLGHLLALYVTAADEQDRAQVAQLAQEVQAVTGQTVEMAFVDQGYTGEEAAQAAAAQGIRLMVIKLPDAKKGFVLLPRRWVVEHSFGWLARFRRLARDYERLPETLQGLHFLAFAILMAHRFVQLMAYIL